MRARDVIVVARRQAGLTQQQLAWRLGVPQSTVGRWESGVTEPKFEAVQKAVSACGLDLSLGFANADEGSRSSLIYEQLRRSPAERVRQLAHDSFDRVGALRTIGATGLRVIVVGEVAGALHGWPLMLNESGGIDLIAHRDDRRRCAQLILDPAPHPERIHLLEELPGAAGYADLARGAVSMDMGGVEIHVAALIDLLRVAIFERDGFGGDFALALDATLKLTERYGGSTPPAPREMNGQEARAEAEKWLSRQSAA